MRLLSLGLFACCVSLAACGGGDDGVSIVVDAGPPDAEPCSGEMCGEACVDIESDEANCGGCNMSCDPAATCVAGDCMCPDDACDGVCVDFQTDETTCGDCDTACQGGAVCTAGVCECPPAFVTANPAFLGSQLTDMIPGAITGFGLYANPTGGFFADALGVAYPLMEDGVTPDVVIDQAYPLTGGLEAPGVLAAYNVDIQSSPPSADAVFAATAGTVTFTEICDVGFSGHADGVTFTGIMSFTNPTPDPSGCTFDVEVVNFSFGEACP